MYRFFFKRLFDLSRTLILIMLFAPLLIILSILVYLKIGFPIIFQQLRPGYQGRIFKMYKFRTMTNGKDEKGNLLPNEQRITKFGKFLR